MYRLRWSSRVRKVMRFGSGKERRRCIMQFSLAAGSERAAREQQRDGGSVTPLSLSADWLYPSVKTPKWPTDDGLSLAWGHTYALHEGGVESVGEQRLRQLPEVQLERSCDGVDIHVAQHHQDVFGIWRSHTDQFMMDHTILLPLNATAALSRLRLQETDADGLKVTHQTTKEIPSSAVDLRGATAAVSAFQHKPLGSCRSSHIC